MNAITRAFRRLIGKTTWWPVTSPLNWGPGWFQTGYPAPSIMQAPMLTFPAVFTSIDTISSDIARLPLRHFRQERGERVEHEKSNAIRVLEEPNGYQSRFDLMKQFVASQLYRGNGYLYGIRNKRYEIDELHVLWPDSVWPYRSGTEVFYEVGAQPLGGVETQRMLTTRECLHHRMLTLADPLIGITPLVAAALSTSAGLAILRQSERFFNQMARPSGVLTTAGKIDRDKAQEIKERWKSVYAGPQDNAGDVAVLEQGLEWKQLTLTATDSQLIEQLRYTVEDVARVYRLPIFMLGDLTKVSYSSSEQLSRIYYSGCLSCHMGAIEERLGRFLGMDNISEWLEFDTDYLFRTETIQRIDALAKSIQGGVRTPNEARQSEGLNAVPGGDTIFMQQQMVPVEVLASRADLTAKPPVSPTPPQTAALPAPEPIGAPILDVDALREGLMTQVFGEAPRLRVIQGGRPPERKLIYGRRSRAA